MANTARLVIDPIAKKISTKYEKIRLVQKDNNSTRVTFEMPRYVRGHDMSNCSTVEVHYDNISIDRKQINSDVYIVNDIVVAPEDDQTINFSWLVSRNATQIVGNVEFSLHFGCDEDPSLEYAWHTTTYSGIVVLVGKHNTEAVVESNPDIFEGLKAELNDRIDKINDSIYGGGDIPENPQSGSLAHRVGELENGKADKEYVDDGLSGKVDKTSVAKKVYGTDADKNQTTYDVNENIVANAVVKRTWDGNVYVPENTGSASVSATSRKFVEDALAEKLKKIPVNETYKAIPVLYGRDASKTADNAKEFAAAKGNWKGNIATYLSLSETYADSDNKGTLAVTTPEKPLHAANKQYVDDGLAGKVDIKLNGTNHMYVYAVNPNSSEVVITPTAVSPKQYQLARYNGLGEGGTSEGNGNLTTSDPSQPYHCANKKYVNDEDKKLSDRITFVEQALGEFVVTDFKENWAEGIDVPSGAFPNIYIDAAEGSGAIMNWETGEVSERVKFVATKVIFFGANSTELGRADITTNRFVTIPEGTIALTFNWNDVDTSHGFEQTYYVKITYQRIRTVG